MKTTGPPLSNIDVISKWVSEPDDGLYYAMNKGIAMATGDIVGILNSDDFYHNETVIEFVVNEFLNEETDSVYGNLVYVNHQDTNKVERNWVAGKYSAKKFLFGWMPPHPTFFVKRKLYESLGAFNCELHISADYELMLRFLGNELIAIRLAATNFNGKLIMWSIVLMIFTFMIMEVFGLSAMLGFGEQY